jgi:hypothetical protein
VGVLSVAVVAVDDAVSAVADVSAVVCVLAVVDVHLLRAYLMCQ